MNVRLDVEDYQVLEAAAFVNHRSLPEEIRALLTERMAVAREDPHVRDMLRIWAEREGMREGVVALLRPTEGQRGAGDESS